MRTRTEEAEGASGTMRPSVVGGESGDAFARWKDDPAGFARTVLGSTWWRAQTEIAGCVARHRRVAVKAANGVGKTYLAADLVLWFLYCHTPSIVLTTAPTWRQVEVLLWEEIRRRFHMANARAEHDPTARRLDGSLSLTRLKIGDGHFAMGVSTDESVRFQGFHAENLLIVLDEACGVPNEIWEAIEGVCVGANNRVLAISNPLAPTGRFYELFSSRGWKTLTLSALVHPNVRRSRGQERIPGAVTRDAVRERIEAWCEATEEESAETFVWEGKRYRPNGAFRARVLGEFPTSAEDSLFALDWIEKAMASEATPEPDGRRVLAVDVARFGGDETVWALRQGNVVTRLIAAHGLDTMQVAARTRLLAETERAEAVVVDEVGIGAGVVDRLWEERIVGLVPVNFGARPMGGPQEEDRYLNLRAQTYWRLRAALRQGTLRLPHDARLTAQLASLRYEFTAMGQIQIESKDAMRRRGLDSPDRADALAMLFGDFAAAPVFLSRPLLERNPRDRSEWEIPRRWMDSW